MTPLLTIAAVFVSLSVASGRPLAQANGRRLPGHRQRFPCPLYRACYCSDEWKVVYCSSFQCPDRSTPIAAASTEACGGDTCQASQCCEAKCSYYQCPTWAVQMENADDIACPDLECTNDLCCENADGTDERATASTSAIFYVPPSASTGAFAPLPKGGGRRLQKPLLCSSLQCPDRATPVEEADITECGDMCDASQCCQAKCSHHQCPDLSTPVDAADETVCVDLECTDGMCCEALCSYYQCPTGATLVEAADHIVCPDLECSAGLCCE